MFMAGLDFVLLAIFVWLIDGQGYKRPVKPLVIMGMNAIAVYMASEILAEVLDAIHWNSGAGLVSVHDWIFHHVFAPIASPMNASRSMPLCIRCSCLDSPTACTGAAGSSRSKRVFPREAAAR